VTGPRKPDRVMWVMLGTVAAAAVANMVISIIVLVTR
jgi:hypothetical protein